MTTEDAIRAAMRQAIIEGRSVAWVQNAVAAAWRDVHTEAGERGYDVLRSKTS